MIYELYISFVNKTMAISKKMTKMCKDGKNDKTLKLIRNKRDNIDIAVVKSFSELVKHLGHFNEAKSILKFLMGFVLSKNHTIQKQMQDLLVYIIANENPNLGSFKLIVLEHFSKLIKNEKLLNMLNPEMFTPLLTIYIEDPSQILDKEKDMEGVEKKLKFLKERR